MRRDAIEGLIELKPARFEDHRGYVSETYNRRDFADRGVDAAFVQDNQTYSAVAGVIRGLHFQRPPEAQGKLVRVVTGVIWDVAVDLRAGSPTYLDHAAVRLDSTAGTQLWIPPGFAHGFCTLEPGTIVAYKLTRYRARHHEMTIRYDDPEIGIDWPIHPDGAILSQRDAAAPLLAHLGDSRPVFGPA